MTDMDTYPSAKRLLLRGPRHRLVPSVFRLGAGFTRWTISALALWTLSSSPAAIAQEGPDRDGCGGGFSRTCVKDQEIRGNQCDDGNECTKDSCHCEGDSCACRNVPRGGSCTRDADPCTRDVCVGCTCTHPPRDEGDLCGVDGLLGACCGGVCCHGHCCNGQCCEPGDRCCDDACCSGSCCKGVCCEEGDTCCAGDVCCKGLCCDKVCCDPDQNCCGGECCDEPCCGGECCPEECCGGSCCESDEVCCQDVCGREGACCDFEAGSCTETTQFCCVADGGDYRGDGTTCTPPDLCQPECDNCHTVYGIINECFHSGIPPGSACGPDQCMRNVLNSSATCDSHPERIGPPQCNTALHPDPERFKIIQSLYDLPEGQTCSGILEYTPWELSRAHWGCDNNCFPKDYPDSQQEVWNVGCVIPDCAGELVAYEGRGRLKVCGCP